MVHPFEPHVKYLQASIDACRYLYEVEKGQQLMPADI
jgi:hypothetical protein